jgi:hypothetical protein
MKTFIVTLGALLLILPMAAGAKTAPKAKPAPARAAAHATLYRCSKCGMTYSAAQARAYHYQDPMDGGKLVPVIKH